MLTEQSTYLLQLEERELLADTLTPVGIYLQVRDKYPNSILLESSDYHGNENSCSYICCDQLASITLNQDKLTRTFPNENTLSEEVFYPNQIVSRLEEFKNSFAINANELPSDLGLYGYMCYDIVQHFEKLDLDKPNPSIPVMQYGLYRFVVAVNHFNGTIKLAEVIPDGEESQIDQFENIINQSNFPQYTFNTVGSEASNFTDEEFVEIIEQGKKHCQLGDVFQVVLSRQYNQQFQGDEFNVYRALRMVNPSPYLFYFDYGSFKLMGSSPESQLVVKNNKATIHPIAGTFRRTGDDAKDAELAKQLSEDEKENAEHVMLVDLARNDLSKTAENVRVEVYKEVQYYSHVIHLVSRVSGQINRSESLQLVADTFPAGTLSGAPKYKAMQLIDKYEKQSRGFYGGAIGFMGFNGEFNHAIMIRSIMSKDNRLTYQAGAGVVSQSKSESEVQEVENKLAAVRIAIEKAEFI